MAGTRPAMTVRAADVTRFIHQDPPKAGAAEGGCGTRNDDVIDTFSVDPRYRSDEADSGADDHGKSGDAE
jgi:hypothetical protein